MYIKKKKEKYWFSRSDCLGFECFSPGTYYHRGATLIGSRNTGNESKCCMQNAYHGCPESPVYDLDLAKNRKKSGWKIA